MNALHVANLLLEDEGSWDFVTDVPNVDVSGAPQQLAASSAAATIFWHLDMDVRRWGVKEFNPIIKSINARILFDDYSSEEPTESDVNIQYRSDENVERPSSDDPKELASFYEKYTAEAQWEPHRAMDFVSIRPTSVEINMTRRHIVVYFS